ncbi:MAG TPA: hypothetical protein VG734_17990 [Lacunisphaera sp.]|nr:hypothetical protein [Lacunisphaera sp.]
MAPVVAVACKSLVDMEDGSEEGGDPILIDNVARMPDALLKQILEIHPHYQKRHSRMAGSDYFMNVCPSCQSHFGDFFLFSEPEGAFFPMTDEAAAAITIRRLPIDHNLEVEGSYSMGLGGVIFEKGIML